MIISKKELPKEMEAPGSMTGKLKGCICSMVENRYGAGDMNGNYVINDDCTLHIPLKRMKNPN